MKYQIYKNIKKKIINNINDANIKFQQTGNKNNRISI